MYEGLKKIKEKVDETAAMSMTDRIRTLKIIDGEIALLRFLTDGDGVIMAYIHELEEMGPQGKRWPKRYCTKEDTGICEFCEQNKPKRTIFLWAYVYSIMHTKQNPALELDQNAQRWQPVKSGGMTYYKEEVNKPMIFKTKVGQKNKYQNLITQLWQEYGTLCDRDYKWSRSGSSLDTDYTLIAKDPSKISKEVKEELENLPKLSDYVRGTASSFSQSNGEVEEPVEEEKTEELF